MNNVNGLIVGIDIQDKITQAAIWDEQTEIDNRMSIKMCTVQKSGIDMHNNR